MGTPERSAAQGRFRRWFERLLFPWNDPAKQAEYDADPDDLIRSGYGW